MKAKPDSPIASRLASVTMPRLTISWEGLWCGRHPVDERRSGPLERAPGRRGERADVVGTRRTRSPIRSMEHCPFRRHALRTRRSERQQVRDVEPRPTSWSVSPPTARFAHDASSPCASRIRTRTDQRLLSIRTTLRTSGRRRGIAGGSRSWSSGDAGRPGRGSARSARPAPARSGSRPHWGRPRIVCKRAEPARR
jgi:hypothetical protein